VTPAPYFWVLKRLPCIAPTPPRAGSATQVIPQP